jgi:hypothetical protein
VTVRLEDQYRRVAYFQHRIGLLKERVTTSGNKVELWKNDCGVFHVIVRAPNGVQIKKFGYTNSNSAQRQFIHTAA